MSDEMSEWNRVFSSAKEAKDFHAELISHFKGLIFDAHKLDDGPYFEIYENDEIVGTITLAGADFRKKDKTENYPFEGIPAESERYKAILLSDSMWDEEEARRGKEDK